MPQSTPPAAILENVPSPVASLPLESIDHRSFHDKIAELKGKIREWHRGEPAFDTLALRVERLDDAQNAVEARHVDSRNNSAVLGAVLVPVAVIAFVKTALISGSSSLEHLDSDVSIGLVTLITLPLQAIAGALIGSTIARNSAGPDLTTEHKQELARLIVSYNAAFAATPVMQIPDSTK